MYCVQCGTAIAADATFCHKCGKPVSNIASKAVGAESAPDNPVTANTVNKPDGVISRCLRAFAPNSKHSLSLSILAVILLAPVYGITIVDAFDGRVSSLVSGKNAGGLIFWTVFIFWYLGKSLKRPGSVGVLLGILFSVSVLFLGGVIAGYVKAQRADILDDVPQFSALKRNFPEVAEKIRQELRAANNEKGLTSKERMAMLEPKLGPLLVPLVPIALKTTSDAAVSQYAKAKVQQFQEVANANASDCLVLMSGEYETAPSAVQARIMAVVSAETKTTFRGAIVNVLNDADALRGAPPKPDEKRFNALIEKLDEKLKSVYGTSAYYFWVDSLKKSPEIRCKAGLLMFKEVFNLPEPDRSFMLRTLFAAD